MARLLAALPIILTQQQDKYCFTETAHIWVYSFLLCRGHTFTDYRTFSCDYLIETVVSRSERSVAVIHADIFTRLHCTNICLLTFVLIRCFI
jgi:hypothetical protein